MQLSCFLNTHPDLYASLFAAEQKLKTRHYWSAVGDIVRADMYIEDYDRQNKDKLWHQTQPYIEKIRKKYHRRAAREEVMHARNAYRKYRKEKNNVQNQLYQWEASFYAHSAKNHAEKGGLKLPDDITALALKFNGNGNEISASSRSFSQ